MLASSPNCWSVLPSVSRYFIGRTTSDPERQQDAHHEGEDPVGGDQSIHVVTVSGWSSSSACGSSLGSASCSPSQRHQISTAKAPKNHHSTA